MDSLRLGINTSFALRRWSQPYQWMELIYSQFELNICELSLDLIHPILREPTKTAYMQEILELGDTYPIEIVSCRTGQNKYNEDLLLHPNFGYRIDAIQWFEKAIDIAAYINTSYVGGYFGGFTIQEHTDPQQLEYALSFLSDSMSYLSSIAYAAGLSGLFFEPFSLVSDKDCNIELNKKISVGLQGRSKIPIFISPNGKLLNIEDWISNFSTSVQILLIQNLEQAKKIQTLYKQTKLDSHQPVYIILNYTSVVEQSTKLLLKDLKETINAIKEIFC